METFYWIAINGASCAICRFPLPKTLGVRPVPQALLGFKTQAEAETQHKFILTADLDAVHARIRSFAGRADVAKITPTDPEPPTQGQTVWTIAPWL